MSNLSRLTVPMCGLLLASTALGAIAVGVSGPTSAPIALAPAAAPEPMADADVATAAEVAPPIAASDPRAYGFVIVVGGTRYVQLTTDELETRVRHDAPRMFDDAGRKSAVASIAAAQLPAHLRDWVGKTVVVDGKCNAHVTGFAKIAQLSGETGYAGYHETSWTARSVMESGSPMLAARIEGCENGSWARDAALPPPALAIPLPVDAKLAAAALADLLRSAPAAQAQEGWHAQLAGTFDQSPSFAVETRDVLHPRTGARWVFVHASIPGPTCGDPHVNLIGVYRVGSDGALVRAEAFATDMDLADLIDVDGDGHFEILGLDGFGGDRTLHDEAGEALSASPVVYFGCPC